MEMRVEVLESQNAALRSAVLIPKGKNVDLLARIETLEKRLEISDQRVESLQNKNEHLAARRREAVAQLLNFRVLHQEAANAFQVRASDIQEDDLEGMIGVYGSTVTNVLNQHQHQLAQVRGTLSTTTYKETTYNASTYNPPYNTSSYNAAPYNTTPYPTAGHNTAAPIGPATTQASAHHMQSNGPSHAYNPYGYCYVHGVHRCRFCGGY